MLDRTTANAGLFIKNAALKGWPTSAETATDSAHIPVPLAGVSIDADISSFYARVVVAHRYVNQEATPIEAVYVFPLDEGAAVCAFEAIVDGTLVLQLVHLYAERGSEERDLEAGGLPTGTATFHFTDVEGSTRLLHAHLGQRSEIADVICRVVAAGRPLSTIRLSSSDAHYKEPW